MTTEEKLAIAMATLYKIHENFKSATKDERPHNWLATAMYNDIRVQDALEILDPKFIPLGLEDGKNEEEGE